MKTDSSPGAVYGTTSLGAEGDAVREQLYRLLASAPFRCSKRYPGFLRYTVEHTLSGEVGSLKERVLGVEVFGRHANYDTSSDPVVRMTAAEVRKRLDHYYSTPGHQGELRIDFPRGSYVPEFTWPSAEHVRLGQPARRAARWNMGPILVGALAIAALITGGLWAAASSRQNALDRFWSPIFHSASPVLLCIPDLSILVDRLATGTGQASSTSLSLGWALVGLPASFQRDEVSFVDTYTALSVASALAKNNRAFRLLHTEDATLDDLKQGPAVLIGGTNNPWINQVSSELRFALVKEGTAAYISDRQNPTLRQWSVSPEDSPADYAIVSRVYNPTTGQWVVMAAGVRRMGTQAAGECFSDPKCFDQAERLAPGDWQRANLQFIVKSQVIHEVPGQPTVVAAYLWH